MKGFISNKLLNLDDNPNGYDRSSYPDPTSIIPHYTIQEVEQKFLNDNKKFNTLVADCEGCLGHFFEENPWFYNQLTKIIYEDDRQEITDYYKIKKKEFYKIRWI